MVVASAAHANSNGMPTTCWPVLVTLAIVVISMQTQAANKRREVKIAAFCSSRLAINILHSRLSHIPRSEKNRRNKAINAGVTIIEATPPAPQPYNLVLERYCHTHVSWASHEACDGNLEHWSSSGLPITMAVMVKDIKNRHINVANRRIIISRCGSHIFFLQVSGNKQTKKKRVTQTGSTKKNWSNTVYQQQRRQPLRS